MTDRTFAPWVEPVAKQLREGRRDIRRTAEKFLPEMWTMPSPLEGWTFKDLLAHLASGDWVFQWMLRGALGEETFDMLERGFEYVNDGNAQRIAERKDTPVEALISEIDSEGEATQELLARLTSAVDVHKVVGRRQNGQDVTIEQWVQGFPAHDKLHGEQLKTALDNVMM
jgi:predicted DNA-binding ribbon-helix-helix protein